MFVFIHRIDRYRYNSRETQALIGLVMPSHYKKNPFAKTSKKRGRKKQQKTDMCSPRKKNLNSRNTSGTWYSEGDNNTNELQNNETEEGQNEVNVSLDSQEVNVSLDSQSASYKKIHLWKNEDNDSDAWVDIDVDEYCSSSNWIMDPNSLHMYLQNVAVCKECHSSLCLSELIKHRRGLGTKFILKCSNDLCKSHNSNEGFNTTKKKGQMFEINQKSVLASRIIGKGRRGVDKFCSVIGLSSPVKRKAFAEHTKTLEKIAFDLRNENFKKAAQHAKNMQAEATGEIDNIIDLPTCFDGSWNSRGWLAKKGFASAIAENTSQVIDIVFKNSTCRLCDEKKQQLKNNEIDNLEYLTWYTSHEENCLYNHDGSPQVCIIKIQQNLVK